MTEIAFTGDIAFSKYFTGRADDEGLLSPAILSFLKNCTVGHSGSGSSGLTLSARYCQSAMMMSRGSSR